MALKSLNPKILNPKVLGFKVWEFGFGLTLRIIALEGLAGMEAVLLAMLLDLFVHVGSESGTT